MNTSGLVPLGHAVLVEPYEPELDKSVIFIPPNPRDRASMVETRAIVVEIGPLAWKDEPVPRAAVGDKIFITNFAGNMTTGPKDNKVYRLVNARDIFCRLEE